MFGIRGVRKTPQVVDERKVIADLEARGLAHEYVSPRLNESFETFAKQAVKEGIEIRGLEVRETEYISIAQPKADKQGHRKVVTE